MRPIIALLTFALQALPQPATPAPVVVQQADLQAIYAELRAIRLAIASAKSPEKPIKVKVKLNLSKYESLGSKKAPVTVVEFSDFQCPYCERFESTAFVQFKAKYVDTGKVRFYSRNFPLDQLHPDAHRAAIASYCAADQRLFWEFRNRAALQPRQLDMDSLVALAKQIGADTTAFSTCVESKHAADLDADLKEAIALGVQGTPSFVIGKSTARGVDGELIEGLIPLEDLDRRLKK